MFYTSPRRPVGLQARKPAASVGSWKDDPCSSPVLLPLRKRWGGDKDDWRYGELHIAIER